MNISPGDSFKWFFDLGVGVAKIFSTYNKIKNKNMFQNCGRDSFVRLVGGKLGVEILFKLPVRLC